MADLSRYHGRQATTGTRYEALPAGKYAAEITNSRMKPTRRGDGHYLELTFRVLEGQYKGRLLWSRLNLDNPSPQAVEIARGELSAICGAVGVMQPRDSSELHDIPLVLTVRCKRREDTGDLTNEVCGYAEWETASGVSQRRPSGGSPIGSNLREPGVDPELSGASPALADREDLPF